MTRAEQFKAVLELRDIYPGYECGVCHGLGERMYSSTSTWRKGVGGQAGTQGICDQCWGSGRKDQPWEDLRTLRDRTQTAVAEGALTHLAGAAGTTLAALHPAVQEIMAELERLSRGRKPRPPWFYEACVGLVKALRRGLDAYAQKSSGS